MSTFDAILPNLTRVLQQNPAAVAALGHFVVNRDLMGRVRLILDAAVETDPEFATTLERLAEEVARSLGAHTYDAEQIYIFEPDIREFIARERGFALPEFRGVTVVDRLATESDWSKIGNPTEGSPRIVFYSIKGGVGRSTALAATAWALAQEGHRVLVLDLDLAAPGISTSLLPPDRQPRYGLTDWLVEDLVGNGATVMDDMVARSPISHDGEVFVVPAHGAEPGEYVSKLGRVWMPTVNVNGTRQGWPARLRTALDELEARVGPTVVLIDARAGIDEVASACLTDIGATGILAFALDTDQTWSGYRVLFRHWLRTGVVRQIRERLQVVAALVPDEDAVPYEAALRERAWDLFTDELYDEVPPDPLASTPTPWSYDAADEGAPHYPWRVRWNRGFATLRSLHGRLMTIDENLVRTTFGPVIDGVTAWIEAQDAT
jgi:hypothetical protein